MKWSKSLVLMQFILRMSTGFAFGPNTTAGPAFGTASIMLGTPATQSQPNFGFGAPQNTQSTTGFQFGTSTSQAPNVFGTPGSNLNFKPGGFGVPTQSAGLFGSPGLTNPVGSLNFPTTSAVPTHTGFGFGTPGGTNTTTSTAGVGLSFGTPASATTTSAAGLFSTPAATTTPTLSFGLATPSTTGLSFGTTMAAASTGGGTGGLFGTIAPSSFNFGTSISTTSAAGTKPAGVLGFGSGPATSISTSLNFGLDGNSTTSTSTATALNPNLTTSVPAVTGLGGLASSLIKTGAVVTVQKEIPPKDQPLPNEILQSVDQFKEIVKLQKLHSSDIARCSIRDFRKVEQEIDLLNNLLNDVEYQLQKNRHLAEKLKYDTAKCLQNVEMAQRTQDTPPGLQYENTAPLRYFLELANQFEREMQGLKIQIESADKYVKNHRNPDSLTPQDLALGMRRLHETFVALAGRLQSVHSQVESQKEIYLGIRKQIYNDSSNPFEKLITPAELNVNCLRNALIYSPPKVATGPTPFNKLELGNGNPLMQHQNQPPTQFPGSSASNVLLGFGSTSFGNQIGNQTSTTSLFGGPQFGQPSYGNTSSNFQLQKPPTGNKRGKQ